MIGRILPVVVLPRPGMDRPTVLRFEDYCPYKSSQLEPNLAESDALHRLVFGKPEMWPCLTPWRPFTAHTDIIRLVAVDASSPRITSESATIRPLRQLGKEKGRL